ncbi:M3 family oligoendopeptidase [Bacillus sp. SG-1]|uniref:M3 family oligoendopeptidase n=1 Tax=Bacillus sp. SG-1 TaxID=161544 RepID=UPI0001543CDA|nr:M3 family oligoendopeptidase [Bacillus sp. SG-1]EDL65912.1 oligoendopeptidase F [Bacillus sp. SG-1]
MEKNKIESGFCFEEFRENFKDLIAEFSRSKEFAVQNSLLKEMNNLRFEFEAAKNLYTLRHVQDYHDIKAEKEYKAFISREADYQELVQLYYQALLLTPRKEELEKRWGKQLFRLAEVKVHSFSDHIKKEVELENSLMGEYGKLLGTAEVEFKGEMIGLPSLAQQMSSSDRETRKAAYVARARYFEENEEKFDDILHRLIKVRTAMSRKLGRQNFISLGYERMNRTDMSPNDLEKYRKQVKKHGVGFVSSLREYQKNNLGVEGLRFFDDKILSADGPPSLQLDTDEFLDKMKDLFKELSSETEVFYDSLMEKGNYDLLPRPGKKGGGYATYLGKEKEPFIFANMSGISNDVRLLTHEIGHAFQFFMSRDLNCPEYIIPVDSAEIFSFAMERFTWPWMETFFGEDTTKYKLSHLIEAFMYMPLASAIDEFEHFLYEQPEATMRERKQKWRELEASYQPELDYDGNEYLEAGGAFHGIPHIYFSPFYFIDYDIAHILAVQLWEWAQKDSEAAWKTYLDMCRAGGSHSLKEHIEAAGLRSPFEEGSLSQIFTSVEKWLNKNGLYS